MGQGIEVQIINATPYSWKLGGSWNGRGSKTAMVHWEFPNIPTVATYSTRNVYIESTSSSPDKNEAIAEYVVNDPNGSRFAFHFIGGQLWVEFNTLNTRNLAVGGHTTLINDRPSPVATTWFILSGTYGSYTSTGAVDHWMELNHAELKDKTLRNLCIPNSHDTGMYQVNKITKLTPYGTVLTQYLSIEGQLNKGIRWFDLRPTKGADGVWYMGHFTKSDVIGWLGAYGAKLDTILAGVSSFASGHNELIILQLHKDNVLIAQNGDDFNLRQANYAEWKEVINYIKNAQYVGLGKYMWDGTAAIAKQGGKVLSDFTIGQYIGFDAKALKPAIVLLVKDDIAGMNYDGSDGVFNLKDSWYFDSSSYEPEKDKQRLQEWKNFVAQPGNKRIPFSYTLSHTQTNSELAATWAEEIDRGGDRRGTTFSSILFNADNYARLFFAEMYGSTDSNTFPAATNVNGITGTQYAAIAMAFNQRSTKDLKSSPPIPPNVTTVGIGSDSIEAALREEAYRNITDTMGSNLNETALLDAPNRTVTEVF